MLLSFHWRCGHTCLPAGLSSPHADLTAPSLFTLHLQDPCSAPHVYAVALTVYQNLAQFGKNQCCLISGESGAGKTETAKLLLNHLLSFETNKQAETVEKQILQTQPLLEAFGNAKTVLNNNSSRFGKYIEVLYHNGKLAGARIRKYLLEKSRARCLSFFLQNGCFF